MPTMNPVALRLGCRVRLGKKEDGIEAGEPVECTIALMILSFLNTLQNLYLSTKHFTTTVKEPIVIVHIERTLVLL